METSNTNSASDVRDFVMRERELALSEREWMHRLRGYGYAIRDTEEGRVVTSLTQGTHVCTLIGRVV